VIQTSGEIDQRQKWRAITIIRLTGSFRVCLQQMVLCRVALHYACQYLRRWASYHWAIFTVLCRAM